MNIARGKREIWDIKHQRHYFFKLPQKGIFIKDISLTCLVYNALVNPLSSCIKVCFDSQLANKEAKFEFFVDPITFITLRRALSKMVNVQGPDLL